MQNGLDDDLPAARGKTNSILCELCGSTMVQAGGCFICMKCGQKKCNTDIT
ncbi:MAG: hypothetical protein AABX01_04185 [Candidatus Micrarchaeota archaeon]